ncbi:MAG TPA: hypothetical protein VLF95_06670, partial [Vicinamibacteria bacterium]|nr:hypothetical protein [Vicinamibacteria bacterium]
SDLARRQHLRISEILAPLRVPGIAVDVPAPTISVLGDAPLLRFTFASLVRQCETDALERAQIPQVSVRVEERTDAVLVHVTGGGRSSIMSAPERGLDLSDAEMSVVHAIVALHGGVLVSGRGEGQAPLFTVELIRA